MRIIFAGTPSNAAFTLEALIAGGFDVVGVLTREDARVGRNKEIRETAVAEVAAKNGIDLMKANTISSLVEAWLKEKQVDLGIVVAYGSIFRKSTLQIPTKGWINVHYSLLPEYPGAAPVQHAILEGREVTGVTVFRLDEGIDTGPILSAKEHPIGPDLTSGELLSELTEVGAELLIETLTDFEAFISHQREQSVMSCSRNAGKITRADARIDFSLPVIDVHNFIRAMNPEPIAWFELSGVSVRVLSAAISNSSDASPGQLMIRDGGLVAGCADGGLGLLRVQPAGKNEMSGADWFRGLKHDSIRIS
jgi:methionyl-tRNA formyltransferase